ncbi:MAG: HEAT repeat domain-containing protein, partial [Candidatus Aminicenantes bacterium]|nr:HEAT repeat domain-containing protein [Candidatus Aminicenantes bacterium]
FILIGWRTILALFGRPNIGKLKDRGDINGLLKALDYRKNETTRYEAVKALGEIGETSVVDLFLQFLEDDEFEKKDVIVSALGDIRDKKAVPSLVQRLRRQTPSLSPVECSALQKIGPFSAGPLLDLLGEKLMDTKDGIAVLSLLEKIGGAEVSEGFVKLLSLNRPALIPHLSDALGRMGVGSAVPALVEVLRSAPEESWATHVSEVLNKLDWIPADVNEQAALSLAERNWDRLAKIGEPAEKFLLPLLRKGRSEEILKAVEILGTFGDERVAEAIAALLDDRRPDVVRSAARVLGKIGGDTAVFPLIQILSSAENPGVLSAVEKALLEIGEPAVFPLIDQLNSGDPHERKTAVRLLGELGDSKALPFLIDARDDASLFPDIDAALERLGWQAPES